MKEIKAYIRKDKLEIVTNGLARIEGLSGVSVSIVSGFGRSRGVLQLVDFDTHLKVEAVCNDSLKDEVVETILNLASTGQRGDGKVFVGNVEESWRVQNSERIDNVS